MPIVLTGFEELLTSLGQIEDRVARKRILATAMRKAEQPILEEFIARAPDDPFTSGNRIQKYAKKSVLDQTSFSVLGKVGDTPKGFVGYFHDEGTDKMSAHPFAEPAAEAKLGEFTSILGENVMLGILGELIEEGFDG